MSIAYLQSLYLAQSAIGTLYIPSSVPKYTVAYRKFNKENKLL